MGRAFDAWKGVGSDATLLGAAPFGRFERARARRLVDPPQFEAV
ncbi:MAG: hypothetical protein ABMB14_22760 [Myxococcota bacterium]